MDHHIVAVPIEVAAIADLIELRGPAPSATLDIRESVEFLDVIGAAPAAFGDAASEAGVAVRAIV